MTRFAAYTFATAIGFVLLKGIYLIYLQMELQAPGAAHLCQDGLYLWQQAAIDCRSGPSGSDRVPRLMTDTHVTPALAFVFLPSMLILMALKTTPSTPRLAVYGYPVSLLLCAAAVFPILPADVKPNALMLSNALAAMACLSACTQTSEAAKDAGRPLLAATAMIAVPVVVMVAAMMHMVLYLDDPLYTVMADRNTHPTLHYLQTIYIWLETRI